MGEWASYGLSDFLMFAPQAYWRLVERYNAAYWPLQALALAGGVATLLLARSRPRAGLVLLALAWAWLGWAFHWQRYAQIFLAAPWLAAASGVQALVLSVAAVARRGAPAGASRPSVGRVGMAIGMAGVLLYPLLALVEGRPLHQAEVFGFMPDPTAVATLGFLLACTLPRWQRVLLAVLPTLSLVLGLLTRLQFP